MTDQAHAAHQPIEPPPAESGNSDAEELEGAPKDSWYDRGGLPLAG